MHNLWIRSSLAALAMIAMMCSGAFGQYSGSGMGTTPTTGTYTPPKGGYSSSTGIAIGVAAAAGVAIAYFALRNRGVVTGCVEGLGKEARLAADHSGRTYDLDSGPVSLNPGERVKLRGKKEKTGADAYSFHAQKMLKNYGSCRQEAAVLRGR